ncbi:MAG TPA: hypothetical protein VFX58_18375 [Chitinophagaceae bacterium]|nr:hypothetical protein [Chitinophagaceae bacterium]
MRSNTSIFRIVITLSASVIFYSCQKSIDEPSLPEESRLISYPANRGLTPYKFERINLHNFSAQGWKEQQVNIASGITIFSDSSDHVEVVYGPENNSDPRLIQGCVTMNLPTSADPALRRVRLRRGGYSGTRLSELTELRYSTYVVWNAPTIMVLQVDINNDDTKDFNIFFSPTPRWQGSGYPPVVLNTWQQWNALEGKWHIEAGFLPEFPDNECTMQELLSLPQYANARIIDTRPEGHNGEGVRFTIGGNPRSEYDNTIGYFDALIIGTKDKPVATLYDFTSNQ